MSKGKIAAQAAHASLRAYLKVKNSFPEKVSQWLMEGEAKVVLKVPSEEELIKQFNLAQTNNIPAVLIRDAGHTQIAPGSKTAVAIGPWEEEELDRLFGELKLL